jgi:hypothetical protein
MAAMMPTTMDARSTTTMVWNTVVVQFLISKIEKSGSGTDKIKAG